MERTLSVSNKTVVAFIGHEAGETVPYRVRMRSPEMAEGLVRAIEREIREVFGKE